MYIIHLRPRELSSTKTTIINLAPVLPLPNAPFLNAKLHCEPNARAENYGCRKSLRMLMSAVAPPFLFVASVRRVSVCAQSFSRAAEEGLPRDSGSCQ